MKFTLRSSTVVVLLLALLSLTCLELIEAAKKGGNSKAAKTRALFEKIQKGDPEVVKAAPGGMLIKVLQRGRSGGKCPLAHDLVKVHYEASLALTDEVFESTKNKDDGEPTELRPNELIVGFGLALELMREGDKWRVWMPAGIAYGEVGNPPTVPSHTALRFDIELVEVLGEGRKPEEAEEEFKDRTGRAYDSIKV